ncbi:MAG: DUF2812 domain-containing protein [Clostridia bacterium]|nr:DUF2812 domain-containing protein [Clostridia bacterium]
MSKNTKKQFRYFTIADQKKEEEYLRKMHNEGWKLVRISGLCMYHFEKCEPEDVVYQLDFDPKSNENKSEYIKMFSDCGWEYIQDFVGYSYFRKPCSEMNGEESIFNDAESKTAMLQRVIKTKLLPLMIIFLCSLVQFRIALISHSYVLIVIWSVLLAVYVVIFVSFLIFYIKSKEK